MILDKTRLVSEGTTQVQVFESNRAERGPGVKSNLPFYNPAMELNRDLSVVLCQWLLNIRKRPLVLLDGLAASGIRGIRFANELQGNFTVDLCEWNPDAGMLIMQNLDRYRFNNVVLHQEDLQVLLSQRRFDYIDIDPYGSPIFFVDAAMRSIKNQGVLACTATDTAALCGVYPKVCRRRYSAFSFHGLGMHEAGVRILLGCIAHMAGRYEKEIIPLLCHATDHYFRIYVQIRKGKSFADASVNQVQIIPESVLPLAKKNTKRLVGPLWMGKLHQKQVLKQLRTNLFAQQLGTKHAMWKLLMLLEEEADASPFYFTTEAIAQHMKTSPPRLTLVLDYLRGHGFEAVQTHFDPTGFKTNASFEEIQKIFKN